LLFIFTNNKIRLQLILDIFRNLLGDILASINDLLSTFKTGRLLAIQNLLDMLASLLSFFKVELLQAFVKFVNIWNRLVYNSLAVVFAKFNSKIAFLEAMIESTDLSVVATQFIATNPFELVGMVKSLHSGMALWTLQPS